MKNQTEQLQHHFYALIAQRQLTHGYLFTGDDLSGKRQVSQAIIQGLACPNFSRSNQPCQTCSICERIAGNQYPDVMRVVPDGQSVKVDQIRTLKEWLSKSPVEASFKLAIIEQAETMNPSSANALLTFLEEPIDNVYLILYCADADLLLPTIRSRVQSLHFQATEALYLKEQLLEKDVRPSHAQILAYFPSEVLDRLMEDYQADELESWFKAMNNFYGQLVRQNNAAFVLIQSRLKPYLSVQQANDSLDYLLLLNHSLLCSLDAIKSSSMLIQPDYIAALLADTRPSVTHLLAIHQTILEVKQWIMANVSPQLAFERLAIKLCRW